MNKRSMKWLWLVPVALLAGYWLYPRFAEGDTGPATTAGPPPSRPIPVRVYEVVPQILKDQIKVNGQVLADEEAELRAELAGKITAIAFDEGRKVAAGTVLVRIDDAELRAERERLEAELGLARDTEARQRNLLAEGTTSAENYDRAKNRLVTLEAELRVVEARLAKTVIRAPFDGVIGFRYVSEGAYVTPSSPIATIAAVDPVKIAFAIPEKYAGRVAVGAEIEFTIPGREEGFTGEVYAIEPRIDARTRTLPIRARAANPDELILPGSFASVTLVFEEIESALLVPTEALIPNLGGNRVFVVEDGRAMARDVTVGIRTPEMVQVSRGIAAGDRVIRTGILQVRDGSAVAVEDAP